MLKSSDPENFFETDASQEKRARRAAKSGNKFGNPIALKSKLLAARIDLRAPSCRIFVAESTGSVRLVDVDAGDGQPGSVYRGPSAPVTCVAVGGTKDSILFAGSWDKIIWSWDIESKAPARRYNGHSDFVKALACTIISGKPCLISGGADKKIIVWDIALGTRLHTLQDKQINMMAVQDLAVDPLASGLDEVYLVSASSDPHIRRWGIRLDKWWLEAMDQAPDATSAAQRTILEHETTVYKVVFDKDSEDVDLWTASGDGTAKRLSRARRFESDDVVGHGDHVRALALTDQWVVTGGRDEDIKFWDRSSAELAFSLIGHYDEVTDLAVLQDLDGGQSRICSVSIDGTVRTWPVEEAALSLLVKEQAESGKETEEEPEQQAGQGLTADEEAELAELMEDD